MIDAAVLSVERAEVEAMVERREWGSKPLQKVVKRMSRSVVVIVIITNTINVLGPIVVGQIAISTYGSTIIGVITAILTFGTIIFSEIIPKSVGAHHAPLIARFASPAILIIGLLLWPIVIVLEWFANLFSSGKRAVGTEEQIRALVQLGRRAGHIETDEGQLIHRAFILNDKTAADIMTPLKDIVGISEDMTIRDASKKVFSQTYSRYPVFGSSIHDITGLAMSHDILEALSQGRDDQSIQRITRDALLVDAHLRSDELLVFFRDEHIHLAVVQDNGKTVGIVTLEDVLEELVGEIEDEIDVEDDD